MSILQERESSWRIYTVVTLFYSFELAKPVTYVVPGGQVCWYRQLYGDGPDFGEVQYTCTFNGPGEYIFDKWAIWGYYWNADGEPTHQSYCPLTQNTWPEQPSATSEITENGATDCSTNDFNGEIFLELGDAYCDYRYSQQCYIEDSMGDDLGGPPSYDTPLTEYFDVPW